MLYQLLTLVRKEMIQIFRNKFMLPVIFLMPVIQMAILVFAATFDLKHIDLAVVDPRPSPSSLKIKSAFTGNPLYSVTEYESLKEAEITFNREKNDLILVFPAQFEKDIQQDNFTVQVLVDAVDSRNAQLASAYVQNTIMQYYPEIMLKYSETQDMSARQSGFKIQPRYFFNPELDYKKYMLPGLLVILTSAVGIFLSAFNIVREKETGTIEQLNVSPIRKPVFIIGKLIPFWIIAMFEMSLGLFIGYLFYGVTVAGPLGDLYLFTGAYLILALGLGLLLSTFAHTQQQVMFLSWFFMMVFILMSGIFTSVENMPVWAQRINIINPLAHFMKVIRMIMLKGSALRDVMDDFLFIVVSAVAVILAAIIRYRKNEL